MYTLDSFGEFSSFVSISLHTTGASSVALSAKEVISSMHVFLADSRLRPSRNCSTYDDTCLAASGSAEFVFDMVACLNLPECRW